MGSTTAVNLARHGVYIVFTYYSNQMETESLIREIEGMGKKKQLHFASTQAICEHSTISQFHRCHELLIKKLVLGKYGTLEIHIVLSEHLERKMLFE